MTNKEFTEKYYLDRSSCTSIKWADYKNKKLLPMWIADMDFKLPENIINKLKEFIEFGDYGYNNLPVDYYKVYASWHKKRNNVDYKQCEIRFSRGAVSAMYQLIYAFTKENDAILINTPLYPPFKATIKKTGRKVIESKMINNDGYFTLNYKDIEKKFKTKNVKMLMLCSPHNPVGRVFKKGELEELFELCKKYNVLVVSDEVHSDIIMPDQTFHPSLSFKKYANNIISINAISKTFSLAVYQHCHIVIKSKKLMKIFDNYQKLNHLDSKNVFCALPSYYCYQYGEEWLEGVINVIYENYNYIKKELGPYMQMTTLEGSYLLFLDLGKYNINHSGAKTLDELCHLRVNAGETFSEEYNNWVRINLATSLDNVKKAVKNIKTLIK